MVRQACDVTIWLLLTVSCWQAAPGQAVIAAQDLQPGSEGPVLNAAGHQSQSNHLSLKVSRISQPASGSSVPLPAGWPQHRLLQQLSASGSNSSSAQQPVVFSISSTGNQSLSSNASGTQSTTAAVASQQQVPRTAAGPRPGMPSATPEQMRPAQVGTPNDTPTQPEGNVPVITAPPVAGAPLYISPDATFESLTEINLGQELLQIPQSFLGLSHEWTHVEELNNIPGYKDIINMLTQYGSGPMVIRVGGGSTDKQARVFPQYVYDALRQVYEDTGALFILGLNFEASNMTLTQGQYNAAMTSMPPESIITFEIGNEPNYFEGTKTNAQGQALSAQQYVRNFFVPDWYNFAKQLSCPCGTNDCCTYKKFAGPVWGHVNVFPTTIKWFLDQTASFVNLTTVHWYKATKETYNTPTTLLEEPPIRKEMDNLRALVQTSQSFGIPLRVAEMNTISNSGRVGVSNVFAATLWTLDGCFEVAATGAVGVNLHQGSGQNLYTSILRWYNQGVLSPPVLRPPFYGMMMFQQAVKAGSKLLGKTQISGDSSNFKVWPLKDANDGELRIVIINKHPTQAGNQTIRLDVGQGQGYDSPAALTRLVARGEDPLSATSGITLGGKYYAVGGAEKGDAASESIPMTPTADGMVSWSVYMPPGSAALVSIVYSSDY